MNNKWEDIFISVVIPIYNSEKTIIPVLNSIVTQTAKEYIKEIIIVNDGSTDNSLKFVRSFKSDIKIIIIDKINEGVSKSRNDGVNKAAFEWIAFCDSDDVWLDNKIERQIEVIKQNSIDCIGGAFDSKDTYIGFKKIKKLHKGTVKEILIKNFPQPSTVMIKKKVFEEIGGFNEEQKYAEDGNFFLKVAQRYNLYYLPEKLINFGFGKKGFGESGLSSNLKGMYDGNVFNLKEMKKLRYISKIFYLEMRIYFYLKYIRRIIITKIKK